jgi:hypothetical protein
LAWFVVFDIGDVENASKSFGHYARAVRGGR